MSEEKDEITLKEASEILKTSIRNIKKLIDEGYLKSEKKLVYKTWKNLIKKDDLSNLSDHLEEIKVFWKSKAKINRQLGIKKTNEIRLEKFKEYSFFKTELLTYTENLPHYQARLIRSCFTLLALDFYIKRKLKRKIIDQELIDFYNKAFLKLIELYQNEESIRFYLIDLGKVFTTYCNSCLEQIKEDKKSLIPCSNCLVDKDYYSVLSFNVNILDYQFNISSSYKDIKNYETIKNISLKRLKSDRIEKMMGKKNQVFIGENDLKTLKIPEIISYLEELQKIDTIMRLF